MRKWTLMILSVVALLVYSTAAFAFRCGGKLVQKGDVTFVVEENCGPPIEREFLGYTEDPDDPEGQCHLKIERWVYGPKNGHFYLLTFEGGELVRIESVKQ